MLKIRDVFKLAMTKMRSHKVWTAAVIFVETILLAVVILMTSVINGVKVGINKFSDDGINGRYLVNALNWRYDSSLERNPEVWDLAERLYDQKTAEHASIAKELGISYSKDSEAAPTGYYEGSRYFDSWTAYGRMAIEQSLHNHLNADRSDLEKILQGYDYSGIYNVSALGVNGEAVTLVDGKEDYSKYASAHSNDDYNLISMATVQDREIAETFLFDRDYDYNADANVIPIIISYDAMGEYFGIERPSGSDYAKKVEYYNRIREKAKYAEITVCYRNDASRQQIFDAMTARMEQERHKNDSDYVPPSLVYGMPETACGPATIIRDVRTAAEKRNSDLQIEYQKRLGSYEESKQNLVTFKVVGLAPDDQKNIDHSSIMGLVKSLGGTTLPTPMLPSDYYAAHQDTIQSIFKESERGEDYYGFNYYYLVEFDNPDSAQNFISAWSCEQRGNDCATEEKRFLLTSNNSNGLIFNDLEQAAFSIAVVAVTIILVFTIFSIGKTISKKIIDDRKEIAVFRSIGFTRWHIASIYIMHTFVMLAAILALTGLIIAVCSAVLNLLVSPLFTTFLQSIFVPQDSSLVATFCIVEPRLCIGIVTCFVLVSLLSANVAILFSSRKDIVTELKND